MFQDNVLAPSSRAKQSKKTAWPLKMKPATIYAA